MCHEMNPRISRGEREKRVFLNSLDQCLVGIVKSPSLRILPGEVGQSRTARSTRQQSGGVGGEIWRSQSQRWTGFHEPFTRSPI